MNNITDENIFKNVTGEQTKNIYEDIDVQFDKFNIKVKVIYPTREFVGIESVSINKDFLSNNQIGCFDVDDFYKDDE